jgi:hypothetical protein
MLHLASAYAWTNIPSSVVWLRDEQPCIPGLNVCFVSKLAFSALCFHCLIESLVLELLGLCCSVWPGNVLGSKPHDPVTLEVPSEHEP